MVREEWNAAPSPEGMLAGEYLLLDSIVSAEHAVDVAHLVEALDTRVDREDIVFLARFDKQRPRRNQAADVIHLGPVQNARDIIVDAMSEAAHAVSERVEISADHRDAEARLQRRCEQGRGAAA